MVSYPSCDGEGEARKARVHQSRLRKEQLARGKFRLGEKDNEK